MTATLPSCTAPISLCESDSTFMRFKPPSSFSGSPSLGSNVGRTPSYDPLAYRVLDIPRFDTPIGGGSSSLRSGIGGNFDFSKIDLSSLGISRGGSPSLDSRIEKMDFSKIDFSSLGKPKEDSSSWDSSTFSYKPFVIPRFDSPPNFGGSSSLRSGIGSGDYSKENLHLESNRRSTKIFSEDGGAPLVRIDYNPNANHRMPQSHLQYGKKFNPERSGNEAADILATIIKLNPKIKI